MYELPVLINTWKALHSFVTGVSSFGREKRELVERALKAIHIAANQTTIYLVAIQKGAKQNKKEESRLSSLWVEAGASLHSLNSDLSRRCIIKSEFWANPEEWSQKEINDARINLETMKSDATTALQKQKKGAG